MLFICICLSLPNAPTGSKKHSEEMCITTEKTKGIKEHIRNLKMYLNKLLTIMQLFNWDKDKMANSVSYSRLDKRWLTIYLDNAQRCKPLWIVARSLFRLVWKCAKMSGILIETGRRRFSKIIIWSVSTSRMTRQ